MAPDRSNPARAYLLATTVSVGGTTVGVLAATGELSQSAGRGSSGLTTAVYLAVVAISAALAAPHVPNVAERRGVRQVFVAGKSLAALAWLAAGGMVLIGAPSVAVLYCAAPVMGIALGATVAIAPQLNAAYLAAGTTMAHASALVKAWSAVGAVIGALLGGLLLHSSFLGWGLVINAALTVPLIVVCRAITPQADIPSPRRTEAPISEIRTLIRSSHMLALTLLNACAVVVFVAPLVSLVVPLTSSMRSEVQLTGAGLMLAAIYTGELLAPRVVRAATGQRGDWQAAALTGGGAACALIVMGLVSAALTDTAELVVWAAVGLVFGALRYASRALSIGAASAAVEPDQRTTALTALTLVAGLVAPIGMLLWGVLIDLFSAPVSLLAAGLAGTAATAGFHALMARGARTEAL